LALLELEHDVIATLLRAKCYDLVISDTVDMDIFLMLKSPLSVMVIINAMYIVQCM